MADAQRCAAYPDCEHAPRERRVRGIEYSMKCRATVPIDDFRGSVYSAVTDDRSSRNIAFANHANTAHATAYHEIAERIRTAPETLLRSVAERFAATYAKCEQYIIDLGVIADQQAPEPPEA